ncbi:hypothetical protein [Haliangium sp.]|uniref:hypothetical protein n=1 Tax=Haliangium sp. TaxID=2663208 RepID=UPI003D1429B4
MIRVTMVSLALTVVGCGSGDGAPVDATTVDAVSVDAAAPDAPDASDADAASPDASTPDAGAVDATPRCADTVTYTGRLLVSLRDSGDIVEYTVAGTPVQTIAVPADGVAGDVDDNLRDLVVDECGVISAYQGTFQAVVARRDPGTLAWSYETMEGMSTANNITYGGVAAAGPYVFATDMDTAGVGAPQGVVRFDTGDGEVVRFATDLDPIDVTLGLDGVLYVLTDAVVASFDPDTLAPLGTVESAVSLRGVAVTAAGEIFGASFDGNIYRLDAAGEVADQLDPGVGSLGDIDVAADGTIAAGARFGDVVLTTVALADSTSFDAGTGAAFVAFTDAAASAGTARARP